ncbi:MAG: class I SAM-dependent methyltransferase [Phycisphaerales bacterium]
MPIAAQTGVVKVEHDPSTAMRVAPETPEPLAWVAHFESVYADAQGEMSRVPWADARPSPLLASWLNGEGSSLVRPGAKVTVVGCGLGDDARELADRGYDVVAFDCSPTAVQWARQRHATIAERFVVADLFALPGSLTRRADLVVEIHTIQAVHPGLRPAAAEAIVSLARPRGTVLAIARGREESEPLDAIGPPFPLTARELTELMHPLSPAGAIEEVVEGEGMPVRRLLGAFRRA